jgi:hypothetical protein
LYLYAYPHRWGAAIPLARYEMVFPIKSVMPQEPPFYRFYLISYTGVITAPITRIAAKIHDEFSYDISKSSIKSGMAGSIMVSANMAIIPRLLKIASIIHGEAEKTRKLTCFFGHTGKVFSIL